MCIIDGVCAVATASATTPIISTPRSLEESARHRYRTPSAANVNEALDYTASQSFLGAGPACFFPVRWVGIDYIV